MRKVFLTLYAQVHVETLNIALGVLLLNSENAWFEFEQFQTAELEPVWTERKTSFVKVEVAQHRELNSCYRTRAFLQKKEKGKHCLHGILWYGGWRDLLLVCHVCPKCSVIISLEMLSTVLNKVPKHNFTSNVTFNMLLLHMVFTEKEGADNSDTCYAEGLWRFC